LALQNSIKTLTIQEVSERSGISKHTLRFWERELAGVIVPLRTKGGQRRYTLQHLFIIEEIKRLKQKGLSLTDISGALNHRFNSHENNSGNSSVDTLADHIAEVVRSAIVSFFENKATE
jgi:DNA-binding transcriptional MerR regulator